MLWAWAAAQEKSASSHMYHPRMYCSIKSTVLSSHSKFNYTSVKITINSCRKSRSGDYIIVVWNRVVQGISLQYPKLVANQFIAKWQRWGWWWPWCRTERKGPGTMVVQTWWNLILWLRLVSYIRRPSICYLLLAQAVASCGKQKKPLKLQAEKLGLIC